MKQMNEKALTEIATKNKTADAVFHILATRERSRGETDLRRLRNQLSSEGFKVVPEEFLDTFKELARAGIGELITEPGKSARFKWHYSLKSVGKSAIEHEEHTNSKQVRTRELVVMLDNKRYISLTVPIDLKKEEMQFVCNLVLQDKK